ncbi:MAG: GtrA family protein [Saprospiraceae bacterium]|nr:GtrA family protein [Saprospiraceae bacterium]
MNDLIIKFCKFGIVGASGVGVDFGITWLCKEKLRLNKYVANSTGFMCAVVSNYTLNRVWTFHSHDPAVATQFSKFLLASLIGLGINNAIIYLLNERLGVKFYTSKLIATGVVTLWNFWANYTFTFHGT